MGLFRGGFVFMIALLVLTSSCSTPKKITAMPPLSPPPPPPVAIMPSIPVDNSKTDSLLENLLVANPQYFDSILCT